MPTPVLPQTGSPSTLEPVRFNMMTGHDGFLPHSPHRVLYQGELYPSAFHLFEALKFLRNERHDIAARIREMENPADVHPLSERMKEYAKEGFERELMEYMDEALYLKFTQHPDLRDQLLNTGVADLIYAEATDPVWGEGTLGQGMNHLGIALRRLRERLRAELAGQ
ncbi:hypothetical protein OE88DRAFT_1637477 [Heliocybe sulcata]|uniref:NADAR domain-containing protein n=1 Tax=Heliocybe sulcata TaxID=5364 RepID=A0A5C3MRB7_9AGAM|nr:hypothetical protein OE88DRAFT_1637477 [Heliocybe sulcata]